MVTREDIEAFLDRLASEGATYREIEPGLWAVRPAGALDLDVVVHYTPPVVVLRVKVMDLPSRQRAVADLNRRLLELNATDLVHGSYGISNGSDRAHRGARTGAPRLRGVPGQLRKHDARARDAPPRAVLVQRGTLGMGIFDRFATLIKSNINDLISSAENPEKMLNQIIVDMRDQLVKAKQQVAAAIADEKRLRDQADEECEAGARTGWQKAELAVRQERRRSRQAGTRQAERAPRRTRSSSS